MGSSDTGARAAIRDARRVVVKVGSSSLTMRASATGKRRTGSRPAPDGTSVLAAVSAGLDVERVNELADALSAAGQRGAPCKRH